MRSGGRRLGVVSSRVSRFKLHAGANVMTPSNRREFLGSTAALLAASVLALSDPQIARALDDWRARQTAAVGDSPQAAS